MSLPATSWYAFLQINGLALPALIQPVQDAPALVQPVQGEEENEPVQGGEEEEEDYVPAWLVEFNQMTEEILEGLSVRSPSPVDDLVEIKKNGPVQGEEEEETKENKIQKVPDIDYSRPHFIETWAERPTRYKSVDRKILAQIRAKRHFD